MPAFPPEAVWSRETKTDLPGLIVIERTGAGRVVYFAADLDRRFARDNNPDLGNLLANAIRWAAADDIPLQVDGPGLLDWHLYRQDNRVVLHCVNLTNEGTWRGPLDEVIPIGPIRVQVKLPEGVPGRDIHLLVSDHKPSLRLANGRIGFELPTVVDHEVVVIS
jgi:hypothetical protein